MLDQVFFPLKILFGLNISVNDVMDVGAEFICLVNNKTKMFCKDNIKNMEKYLPEVYILLPNIKPMVPGDRSLLAIGGNFKFLEGSLFHY